jgi:hypothetical protein
MAMGTCCADHAIPLYPQKLAPISPTIGGRSVDMVRLRTKIFGVHCLLYSSLYNCYGLDVRGFWVRVLTGSVIALVHVVRPAAYLEARETVSPGLKRPKLRKHGFVYPLPHTSLWLGT